jgi:hypothetical protein
METSFPNDVEDHNTNTSGEESEEVTSNVSSLSSPSPPPRKILPSRVTRGRRMGRLVGEIAEADEMFWNQDAFREDESDESVAESDINSDSSDGSDSADSDIDKSEPDEDDNEEGGGGGGSAAGGKGGGKKKGGRGNLSSGVHATAWDDDVEGKKKGRYVDPALKGKRGGSAGGGGGGTASGGINFEQLALRAKASLEAQSADVSGTKDGGEISIDQQPFVRKRNKNKSNGGEALTVKGSVFTMPVESSNTKRLSVRASTQILTEHVKQKEMNVENLKKQQLQNKQELLKRSREEGDDSEDAQERQPIKKLSQSESLIQAAKTTVENLLSLDALLSEKRDDDVSGGGGGGKGSFSGSGGALKIKGFPIGTPLLRFLSKRGQADTLTFTDVDDFPRSIKSSSDNTNVSAKCAVTGKIASYRDPLTGAPYADVDAYKMIKR